MGELITEDNNSGAKVVVPIPSGNGIIQEVVDTLGKDTPVIKTKRTPRKKPEVPKGNAQEIVEKLKDQIAAIEYIDGVEIKDLPAGGLKKELRDILIEFRKEIEIIKGAAINTIIDK